LREEKYFRAIRIAMKGDDYDHKRRVKRVPVNGEKMRGTS
jgi:hypothetical protein